MRGDGEQSYTVMIAILVDGLRLLWFTKVKGKKVGSE
jgi:hypothetical protein